ncbi:TRAP transporter substrate-binding protein [Aliihoeflea sp. PC F10.4]
MERRWFLGFGAAGAATVLAAPAIAQERRVWRMVTTWPRNFPGQGVAAQRIADDITAASDGRLTVEVYPAGELVPPLQALDAVIDGNAEMMHGTPYYWQNKSLALSFFSGVPYGMNSRELTAWVRVLGGQELWDEVYEPFGVRGFLAGDTGTQGGGWFRNELNSLEDIRGLRFRTPGLGGQVWQRLGASVTNMAAGEIFQALQSGTLDAAEFVGPYNDLALGFHQITKNYYSPSFTEPALAGELVVDRAKFDELPNDLQAIVRLTAQAAHDAMSADFAANDPLAFRTLMDEHGVTLRAFPDDVMEAGAGAARDIIEEMRSSSDAMTQKVTEAWIAGLATVRQKTDDTELPFLMARQRYFQL